MSLWDFVAAASISKNINDPTSHSAKVLKKINSATLSVVNGDAIGYVSGGGRTTNTFGANTTFICDIESLFEGAIGGAKKWSDGWGTFGHIAGGILFGPGAENKVVMGNVTQLTYMPHHSSNFTVYRGGKAETFTYNEENSWEVTSFWHKSVIWLFALTIFGFELIYSMAGVFKAQLMSPVGDSKYIASKEAEIKAQEKELAAIEAEEAKRKAEQQQREASGDVPSPEQMEADQAAEHAAEKQKEEIESNIANMEATLKTAERQREWLLFSNVIIENRGILILKLLEKIKAELYKAKGEMINAQEKVDDLKAKLKAATEEIAEQNTALLASAGNPTAEEAIGKQIEELKKTEAETAQQLAEAKKTLDSAKQTLANLK